MSTILSHPYLLAAALWAAVALAGILLCGSAKLGDEIAAASQGHDPARLTGSETPRKG